LEKAIEEGTFREDLYYRLNVVSIEVPPLRERKDEILPLAEHFFQKHCQPDAESPVFTEELRRAFLAHDWPGNVRELENVVRRYLVFEDAHRLSVELQSGRSLGRARRLAAENRLAASAPASTPEPVAGPTQEVLASGRGAALPLLPEQHVDFEPSLRNGKSSGEALERPYDEALEQPVLERPALERPALERIAPLHANPNLAGWAAKPVPTPLAPGATNGAGAPSDPFWISRLDKLENLLARLVAEPPRQAESAQPRNGTNGHSLTTLEELDEQRNQAETGAILAALEKTEWNRKKAARLLNTDYKALLYRMKKLGIGERNEEAC
jgi:DNA-binding NtrC family response regulator